MRGFRDVRGAAAGDVDVGHREDERGKQKDAVDGLVSVFDPLPQVESRQQGAPLAHGLRLAHFSGTRIPSRPVGRKTRTPIRMPKITTSVHFDPRYESLYAEISPMMSPPSAAPGMLPMPPNTADVNATRPVRKPRLYVMLLK